MALIGLHDITLGFGGRPLLEGITLHIEAGERICLLGRNGTGKSTLIRIINGETAPDGGETQRQQGIATARLTQEVPDDPAGTVEEIVARNLRPEGEGAAPDWEADQAVAEILSRMDLDPSARFADLSAGLKRRVLLAGALVRKPDLLLLDEPTNHLDIESIRWLEGFLRRQVKTLLFVTHDRAFLKALATRIVELDRGRLFNWACDYETYLARKAEALETEARGEARFDRKLAAEEAWIRQGVKARRTRNEGRVRSLERLREERRRRRERMGSVRMVAQEAERTGKLVIEASGIGYTWGDRTVVRGFSTAITRGDKVGIIGPNGCGKTTLLSLLLGGLEPETGSVRHGVRLSIAYFDQLREQLDETRTVQENVADGNDRITMDGRTRHVIGYLGDFLFPPERARSPVSMLSGGERNRLLLARLFTRPANVLVLDEPTNDLDLETLELLEDLLVAYSGTVLLVSHDRAFLDNVVTSVLAFEGEGRIGEYVGGYDDWLRQRPSTEPAGEKPLVKPSRPKPRPDRPRKLTFKEGRELADLPARIEALEAERDALHQRMADPDFYRGDGETIAAAKDRLEALEGEIEASYARWETLETVAEEAGR